MDPAQAYVEGEVTLESVREELRGLSREELKRAKARVEESLAPLETEAVSPLDEPDGIIRGSATTVGDDHTRASRLRALLIAIDEEALAREQVGSSPTE